MKTLILIPVSAMLLLVGCERAIEVREESLTASLVDRCFEVSSPLFLVRYSGDSRHLRRCTGFNLVPPDSALAPLSVDEYEKGVRDRTIDASIVRVVRAGAHVDVRSVWLLKRFENPSVAIMAKIDSENAQVNVANLLGREWEEAIAEGSADGDTVSRLGRVPVFEERFLRNCDE